MYRINMEDQVILVDENDNEVGAMPKLEAHQKGILHRAFSIFIFNSKGEVLLQQRSSKKYHSANLWSNTCCSHPLPGEAVKTAAQRRLMEEMGMTSNLTSVFNFIYKATLSNSLFEYEYDHVFFGVSELPPIINQEEVRDWKYISYTEWLKNCIEQVITLAGKNNY
jgi:isopentenyl-diphosphate Delta-isomerase